MSAEENKRLIRRYIEALDDNDSSDWSILDEYIAEDFVAHTLRSPASASTATEEAGGGDLPDRDAGPTRDPDADRRGRDGRIVEYWSVTDVARVLQQVGALPGPP